MTSHLNIAFPHRGALQIVHAAQYSIFPIPLLQIQQGKLKLSVALLLHMVGKQIQLTVPGSGVT